MLISKYDLSKKCRCISVTKWILEYVILQNIANHFKEGGSKNMLFSNYLWVSHWKQKHWNPFLKVFSASGPIFSVSSHPGLVRILLRFYRNITNRLGMWSFRHTHIAAAVYYGFFVGFFSKLLQALILRKPAWIQFILIKI